MTSHGVGGYRSGCRCAVCRSAETLRKRSYRARAGGKVVAMPTAAAIATGKTRVKPKAVGSVEQAVLEETAPLPKSAEQPALVAGAIAMAHVLDNDSLVSMHPAAARQLQAVLQELHRGPKRKSNGRLAAVRMMSR